MSDARAGDWVDLGGGAMGEVLELRSDGVEVARLTRALPSGAPPRRLDRSRGGTTPLGRRISVAEGAGLPLEVRPRPTMPNFRPTFVPTGAPPVDLLAPLLAGDARLLVSEAAMEKTKLLLDWAKVHAAQTGPVVFAGVGWSQGQLALCESLLAGARERSALFVTEEDEPPLARLRLPRAAAAFARELAGRGERVLLVIDDFARQRDAADELARERGKPSDVLSEQTTLLDGAGAWGQASPVGTLTVVAGEDGERAWRSLQRAAGDDWPAALFAVGTEVDLSRVPMPRNHVGPRGLPRLLARHAGLLALRLAQAWAHRSIESKHPDTIWTLERGEVAEAILSMPSPRSPSELTVLLFAMEHGLFPHRARADLHALGFRFIEAARRARPEGWDALPSAVFQEVEQWLLPVLREVGR